MPDLSVPLPRRALAASLAFVLCLGVAGCDHMTEPAGPRLIDRFGPFAVIEPLAASRSTVDFAAGEDVVFTATFNKQVAWVVEVTGQESGAVKRIEGFSSELSAANATWTGGTTELPFFKAEPVVAVLTVPAENSDTTRADVEVLTPRTYPGSVVTAFESRSNITVGNFEFEFASSAGISAEVPAAQGDFFYLLRGADTVVRNFFVGLLDIRPPGGGFYAVPTTAPEDLYLNFFLYSFDTPHTIAVIQVIADGNGSGGFEDGSDTVFPFGDINVEGEGWQAFSKPLSELGLSAQQAREIVALRVLLISNSNTQPTPALPVEYGIDYLTFTAGGPLEL